MLGPHREAPAGLRQVSHAFRHALRVRREQLLVSPPLVRIDEQEPHVRCTKIPEGDKILDPGDITHEHPRMIPARTYRVMTIKAVSRQTVEAHDRQKVCRKLTVPV